MAPPPDRKKAKILLEPVTIAVFDPPGQVVTRILLDGRHEVVCDLCGTVVTLSVGANRHWCLLHRASAQCRKAGGHHHYSQAPASSSAQSSGSSTVTGTGVWNPGLPSRHLSYFAAPVQPLSVTTIGQPSRNCPGIGIEWTPGSHWMAYPFLQHGVRALAWEPVGFAPGNVIFFRSENCQGQTNRGDPCYKCQLLPGSLEYQHFVSQAKEHLPRTPWAYLTAQQQLAEMARMTEKCLELTTKLSNSKRSAAISKQRISEHKRILILLSTNDIAGLRRTLTVQLKRGVSAQAIA
ncbi:hypothetical protein B0H14DRAFT_2568597 [Mycena olivaceomarginata]|nr:hypothetical protein B0H14DRAFT_2568597 [Mycena olivaceomarginata]